MTDMRMPDMASTMGMAELLVGAELAGTGATVTLVPQTSVRATRRDTLTRTALRVADLVAATTSAALGTLLADGAGGWAPAALFTVLVVLMMQALGLYGRDGVVLRASLLDELPTVLQAVSSAAALTVLAGPVAVSVDQGALTRAWLLACLLLPAGRQVARAGVFRATAHERVLILGSGVIGTLAAYKIGKHPELGLRVVGCIDVGEDDRPSVTERPELLGGIGDIEDVIARHGVDRVVIAFSAAPHDDLLEAIRRCKRRGLKIDVIPRLFEVIGSRVEVHSVEGLTLLGLRGHVRSRGALAAKRAMDVVVATAALVVLSPLFLLIAVLVRLSSPGPVLFRQERIGRGQQPFAMLKFRTMVKDAEALKAALADLNDVQDRRMFKMIEDPRITPVGRLLRCASLDELPQFVNVLRGEMSLVGPRPLIRSESDAVLGWHRTRLDLTPGLTGPWQVMGRQHVPFDEMVKIDYLYVAEWSLWQDVKLVLRTVPVVLRRTGA
jgi:exopolysaccharide biosynthesis polyprenyl glycosylphosphotransferase